MRSPAIPQKWRPPLALIVFGVLLSVLALPAATVIAFRALDRTMSRIGPLELGALLVALVLTLIIAFVFSRTITGPIEALVKRTEEIGRGGRAAIHPLERYGTREIAVLSQSFLDLAGRLVDRSDYTQSFAAHVSHELKSPLTSIKGAAELLRDAEASGNPMRPADRRRFLEAIIADADRLALLLERLRELARAELGSTTGTTSVRASIEAVRPRFGQLTLHASGELDGRVAVSGETLAIALAHLADNAGRHGAGALTIHAAREAGRLCLIVSDDGEGISEGNRSKIFEPFFTTRRESGGTGMGLRIVRTMLEAHGGSIELLVSDKGAAFEISLPPA